MAPFFTCHSPLCILFFFFLKNSLKCVLSVPSIVCICLTFESTALYFRAFSFMVQPSPKAQRFGNDTIFLNNPQSTNQSTNPLFSQATIKSDLNFNRFSQTLDPITIGLFLLPAGSCFPSVLIKLSALVFMLISWSAAAVIERLIAEQWAQALEPEHLDEISSPPEMIECFAHLHGQMKQAISASLFSSEKCG